MKKLLVLCLLSVLIFAFAGCDEIMEINTVGDIQEKVEEVVEDISTSDITLDFLEKQFGDTSITIEDLQEKFGDMEIDMEALEEQFGDNPIDLKDLQEYFNEMDINIVDLLGQ